MLQTPRQQQDSLEYQQARLSRDSRFDGHFFVGVKTTGIFCRPICPATLPLERNIEYIATQAQALQRGYRPCLRCRPDSAPGSWAWKGTETTFQRAISLIDQGALQDCSLSELASRLGISPRYLRRLFQQYLGMPPKQYAQYQQLMFAKQLLHSSHLSMGDIALASGFNSVRRFNDAFQKTLKLTPSAIRTRAKKQGVHRLPQSTQHVRLSYRPPFNWEVMLDFYRQRAIQGVEEVGERDYFRYFVIGETQGWFRAELGSNNTLLISFEMDDITQLKPLVSRVRRLFDLDADSALIEQHLKQTVIAPFIGSGIRIPGVWDTWEAGIRAIFGQQVSVKAAISRLNHWVAELGDFPRPADVLSADLSTLKMPQSRKDTLYRFAEFMQDHPDASPEEWLALKGIGPWTISYAKLRGLSQADCFLSGDLGIQKAVAGLSKEQPPELLDLKAVSAAVSPWGSYATFHCWSALS